MPLFDAGAEKQRKDNLKMLEDKRVLFAEKLEKIGFVPERTIFFSNENGSFTALARVNGKYAVILGPAFGSESDFVLEFHDELRAQREDVFEKGTGLNGAFGFGTKGARGFRLTIAMNDGSEAVMSVVAGRTSWMEATARKNPLLKTKRRRGDANLIWDMMPIDPAHLAKIENLLAEHYLT